MTSFYVMVFGTAVVIGSTIYEATDIVNRTEILLKIPTVRRLTRQDAELLLNCVGMENFNPVP